MFNRIIDYDSRTYKYSCCNKHIDEFYKNTDFCFDGALTDKFTVLFVKHMTVEDINEIKSEEIRNFLYIDEENFVHAITKFYYENEEYILYNWLLWG